MEDREKLRKIIRDTRLQKNIARDKISELLKQKGIKYAESSLSRYENGITESIKAEVLKGISEILGLNLVEMYKLAGLLSEKEDDVRILGLNKREKAQRQKFLEDNAVFFFNDENVSEEDKDKLMLALNNAYFRSKEIKRDKKNKK